MEAERDEAVGELLYTLCSLYTKEKDRISSVYTLALHMLGSELVPSVLLDECRLTERLQKKLLQCGGGGGGGEANAVHFMELYQKLCSQPLLQYRHSLLSFLLALMGGADTVGYSRPQQPSLLLGATGLPSGVETSLYPRNHQTPPLTTPSSTLLSSRSSGLGSSVGSSYSRDSTITPEEPPSTANTRTKIPFSSTPAVPGHLPPPSGVPKQPREAWSEIHHVPSTSYRGDKHRSDESKDANKEEVTSCVPAEEVSELGLLSNLIYVFQDIEAEHIRFNHKEDAFRLHPQTVVSPPVRVLCHKLAELGWLHRKIRHFIDSKTRDRSQGLVVQSFCSALSLELTEYYRLVAVLDAQVRQQEVGVACGLTLRRLLVWTSDPKERLQMLAVLVEGCKRLKGGALVSCLYHYGQHGDPAVRSLVLHLLTQVYLPLHHILHSWLFEGLLYDRAMEFFIMCDDSSKPEKLWRSKYNLRQSMLPSFISHQLAQKILTIGKSINFLRQICGDHTQLGGDALQSWYLNEQGKSSFDSMTGSSLKSVVDSAYRETSKYLLKVVHTKYNLMEHMKALRRYLLLGQGDFIRHLMDLLAPELSKPASSLYLHNLTGTLEAAIRGTNAQYDRPEALQRLDVRMLDLSPGDKGWDVFSLHYHVDGPIGTVFTSEAMLKYLRVFNFLWRSKRMEYSLVAMWKEQTSHSKLLRGLGLSQGLHQSHLLVSAMVHFMTQLQYYITFEVLECSWAKLLSDVGGAEDLDQVIQAHHHFLEKITSQCLLDADSQPLLTRLRAIYDLIVMFQHKQAAMYVSGVREVERRQVVEEERDSHIRQGEWRVTEQEEELEESKKREFIKKRVDPYYSEISLLHTSFKDMVGELMVKLKGHSEQSLQFLRFRLDFNQHYSNRQV